jgi:hypothetical protein
MSIRCLGQRLQRTITVESQIPEQDGHRSTGSSNEKKKGERSADVNGVVKAGVRVDKSRSGSKSRSSNVLAKRRL